MTVPYPGESLPIFQGWSAAGDDYTLAGDVVYRGGELDGYPGYRTISAGDEWRAWVGMYGTDYLDAPGDCDGTPSWVVVVDSGSAVVTVSEGQDDDFGNPSAAHPTSLGTVTLTAGDNVIPSTFTVADLHSGPSSMMLVLDAVSGSAVVSQVKMRLWPSAGVAGGWSDLQPAREGALQVPVKRSTYETFEGSARNPDPAASWDAAMAAYHADVSANSGASSRTFTTDPDPALFSASQGMGNDGEYVTNVASSAAQVVLTAASTSGLSPVDGALVEGVDWVRPPDEVRGDVEQYAQLSGSITAEWADAYVTVSSDPGTVPGTVTMAAEAGDWPDENPGSGVAYSFAFTHTPTVSGVVALPTTGSKILVVRSHSMATGEADTYPGWAPSVLNPALRQETVGLDLSAGRTYVAFPPYRYWDPTAVEAVVHPLRLMQRGDGLGMGSGRVYGAGTRQNSTRVFGSL